MGFIREIKKKLGIIPDNKTEEINEERSKIRKTMAENLKKEGFTQEEIDEVLSILTKCEEDVLVIKESLKGSNINNDYTIEIMQDAFAKIRKIEMKAAEDIKMKVAEIAQRKKKI